MGTTRAAIYTRISRDTEGEGLGVERQREDCEQLCLHRGWEVVGLYTDNDRSAFSGKTRPRYEALLEDVKAGEVDVIVAWHPDRLHRSPLELEHFVILLEATDVTVATVTAGDRDFATPDGRFMARMEGTIARRESEHKSERITRKFRQLAEGGHFVAAGGRKPFGYDRVKRTETHRAGIKVNAGEARLIKEAARRVLAGESLYAVAEDWNARGVATVTGVPWTTGTLRQILIAGRIAAWRDHHGEPVAKTDEWKAIVDEDTWRALRSILTDPARKRTRVPRRYLLGSELLRCGAVLDDGSVCGGPLKATPQRNAAYELVPVYGCRRKGCGLRVVAAPVEEMVGEWTLKKLASPDFVARVSGEGLEDDEAQRGEVVRLERDLEGLSRDFYVDKVISRTAFLAADKELTALIEAAKGRLAQTTRRQPTTVLVGLGDLHEDWSALDAEGKPKMGLDRKRALIAMVLESVNILPAERGANTFDPARVVPTFRA